MKRRNNAVFNISTVRYSDSTFIIPTSHSLFRHIKEGFFYDNRKYLERWSKGVHNISAIITTSHYSNKLQYGYPYIFICDPQLFFALDFDSLPYSRVFRPT